MKTDGEPGLPPGTFDHRFAEAADRLGLGGLLDRNELNLLYEASLHAWLCNRAFNGVGSPDGQIRSQDEAKRSRLEQAFMEARNRFYASPGWQNVDGPERQLIERWFLSVNVMDAKLAW